MWVGGGTLRFNIFVFEKTWGKKGKKGRKRELSIVNSRLFIIVCWSRESTGRAKRAEFSITRSPCCDVDLRASVPIGAMISHSLPCQDCPCPK